ncbi:hypothetical protein GCM10010193_32510 [Kitasatospora atroaurantiaca]
MRRRFGGRHPPTSPRAAIGWAVFQCPGCRGVSLAQGIYLAPQRQIPGAARENLLSTTRFIASGWYPTEPLVKTYPDSVPTRIAEMASEAYGCLSVKHHRAAVIMARTVIEASAKAVGVTDYGIRAKIKKLLSCSRRPPAGRPSGRNAGVRLWRQPGHGAGWQSVRNAYIRSNAAAHNTT